MKLLQKKSSLNHIYNIEISNSIIFCLSLKLFNLVIASYCYIIFYIIRILIYPTFNMFGYFFVCFFTLRYCYSYTIANFIKLKFKTSIVVTSFFQKNIDTSNMINQQRQLHRSFV